MTPTGAESKENGMAIAAVVTMTPKDGKRQELEDALQEVLELVRTEPGNLVAMVLRDPAQTDKVIEFVVFRDQEAIEAHWQAEHSLRLGPGVRALQAHDYD